MDLEEKGCWRYIYLEKNTRREENMTEWRLRECPAYADTYIEWRFECRCKELKDGVNILTEWRDTKRQCISILEGTMFDFQHFSRHDASHSINILEAVEMLLGKDRIDLLSVGDLWMLLECAYIHDVGMSLTFDELAALWEEPEFKEHIQKAIAGEKDNQAAAAAYLRVDNLIRDRKLEGLESYIHDKGDPLEALTAAWPIELERGVAEIIADYIRERHPNRVVNAMRKMDAKKESAIPERLYKMMSLACEMHGHDFSDIQKEMKYCTKGFGNTVIHPMFAAAMLRMGDLLDMDNNRFHVRALEHFGTLPHTSMLHYNKHKAMTHIAIRREGIEAEAVSDDMETCKVINSWFESVKRETNHLICAWNDIVPPELFGCYLKVSKCQVFYENHKQKNMFQAKADTEFSVDKSKLIKLLMGTNIYYSKIDFLREYLQNALDASKMKLWLDLKADAYRFSDEFSQKETLTEIAPFDIGKSIYDRYTIEIGVDIDRGRQKIELSISDKGIGIEKDCIDVVSCVGSGWRKRKKYQDDIRKMPQWMRPTGGFGVGIQSAFMITDEVRISTRGVDENEGTKLILKKPENGGNVSQESWMNGQAGTTVEMSIDINCFREIAKEFTDENKYNSIASSVAPECDFFDAAWTLDYVYGLLKKYIETIFPNTPIPMRIIKNKKDRYAETALCITSFPDFMFNGVEFRSESFITKKIELNNKQYQCFWEFKPSRVLIWDYQDSIWACISKRKDKETSFNIACFKNARVMEEEAMRGIHAEYYDLLIDYMGFKAEKILQVHRNRFNSDFSCAQYYSEIFSAYYQFCKRISAEEKAFAEGKTGTGISILVSRRDECLVEMLHMDAIHEDSFEFMGNENDSDKYSIVKRWGDFPDFTDEKIESKTVLKDMEAVLLKSDGVIVAVCEEADDSDDTSGFDRVKQKTTDEVTVLKRAKIEQWKAGPESGESADDGMETYDCIVKKGYAIKEKTVVKILLSCRSLEKKYVQIEGADFKLVILSHSKEPEKMDEDTFYACSYQGFPNGWIDAAESVDGYSALYVDMIPYQTGQESRLPGGYLLSPVRKTARNALDKLYDLPRIDNKTGKRGRQKVSRKAFTNCIIQQEEYKALLDWVYKHQLKRGDEQLVGRDEIRKAYDRYIRKIYDWKEKNAELERVGHS